MSKKVILDEIERMQNFLKKNCNVEEVPGTKLTNIQKMYRIYNKVHDYISELPEGSGDIEDGKEKEFLGRVGVLTSHTELILSKKVEDEEFSYDNYELKSSFLQVADRLFPYAPGELAQTRRIDIAKPITFEGEYTLEKICNRNADIVSNCNWDSPGVFLVRHYSSSQMDRMAGILSSNFTKNANGSRHGALGFMFMALMAKGYSPEDMLEDKVKEEDYEDIYNHIVAMKPEKSDEKIDDGGNLNVGMIEEINDKKTKREQAIEWADEIFIRGSVKAFEEHEKRVSFDKRQNTQTYFSPGTSLLGMMIMQSSTNYMEQDPEAVARIKAMESRLALPFKGHDFHITEAYTQDYTAFSTYSLDKYKGFLGCFSNPRQEEYSLVVTPLTFIRMMAEMQTEYTTEGACNNVFNKGADSIENGEEFLNWFNKNVQDPEFFVYLNESLKKPSELTNMYINPETGLYVVGADMKKVKEDYAKFVKEHGKEAKSSYNISKIEGTLDRAIKKDTLAMTITPKGLEEVSELHRQKDVLTKEINSLYKNRLEEIVSSLKEMEQNPKMCNKENYEKINKVKNSLKSFTDPNEVNPVNKYRLLTNDDLQFTEASVDNMDYKGKFEYAVKDVLKKADGVIKKLPKAEKVENLSKKEISDKLTSLKDIMANADLKKAENKSGLDNTINAIKEIYGNALEQLKQTCEFDKETGRPTGNTQYFDSMYDSIEAVAKYKPGKSGPSLNELLDRARKDVCTYRDKRDSFIKWTTKGRTRLDFAKDMADVCVQVSDKYDSLTLKATEIHGKNSKALSEKEDLSKEISGSRKPEKPTGKSKSITMNMETVPGKK